MAKPLQSSFELYDRHLTREEFIKAFQDFEFFMSHCQQIVNKRRELVPMALNPFQKEMFKKLLPMVDPKTRQNKARSIILLKSRRVGASTGLIAFMNYILSYVEGIENTNVLHLFPTSDSAGRLYSTKVKDIVTGVHGDLMPTIYKDPALSSIVLNYQDILGVRRHNSYEMASANTSSLRGSDFHIAIMDEISSYRHPENVEAVVEPMLPEHGFSLMIYASTFDDGVSLYYKEKIQTAIANPDIWDLIFVPWFVCYPEDDSVVELSSLTLTDYDQQVIMPALADYNIPQEQWGAKIAWYHAKRAKMTEINMHKEFPTTLEEVLSIGVNKKYFSVESLDKQEQNIMPGQRYKLFKDPVSNKYELIKSEESPITVFKPPMEGHKYIITVDPITANNEDTDLFSAIVWDQDKNEQVATFRTNELQTEDYAEYIVGLATVYRRALICPEKNVAEAFNVAVRGRGYYYFWYESSQARNKKDPGIRTTVASKAAMLDRLNLLLDGERIVIRDENTLRQLRDFERQVRNRADGSTTVKATAPKGKRDDDVACAWIFAGTLDQRALSGKKDQGFSIL